MATEEDNSDISNDNTTTMENEMKDTPINTTNA